MLLAFGHKARQGKDTAGEAVVEYYNLKRDYAMKHLAVNSTFDAIYPEARIFKFADELYRICREEYGMTKKNAHLLQKVGNGRREEFGPDYWIKQLAPKIAAFKGIAVITDMRYQNEAAWIKSLDGHTIKVTRLNADGTPYYASDRDPNHISEVDLDGYNYDHFIKAKTGDAAIIGELAITLSEYLRALEIK